MMDNDEYTEDAVFASLPRTIRGMPLALNASPDGQKLVYCNGNSVFIRDLQDIAKCDIYTEHAHPTTVAKFSPSGYYVASGDNTGRVRIWDATQPTHILKAEYPILSGPVRDISWSEDSKRIAVVGEGRDRFGHVFLFDTGTSNGNISGQSRTMTSIDFRPARPYRLVSGSEDNTVAIFEGPPFKFTTHFREHSRFVYCVRYNATGSMFASAGADGKIFLYEGLSGQKTGELIDEECKGAAHGGSVFGLCWSPDGQRIATSSGDKTVKVWNVETKKLEKTFTIGKTVDEQQLSVIWTKHFLASVSLSGFINVMDIGTQNLVRIFKGHNKPITALAVSTEQSIAFTSDFEGNITRWCLSSGETERITPMVHTSQVSGMCVTSDGNLVSVGWDDKIAFTNSVLDSIVTVHSEHFELSSQPRGVTVSSDGHLIAVACQKNLTLFDNGRQTATKISYEATCISLHPGSELVAVGSQVGKVYIYKIDGTSLVETKVISQTGAITSIAWSPNGRFLVATDANRKVVPYSQENEYKVASQKEWTFHTARVNCVAWSPDSRFLASGSIDTNIIIWDLQNSGEHPIILKGAHKMNSINGIAWLDAKRVISVGQDSVVKIWTIKI